MNALKLGVAFLICMAAPAVGQAQQITIGFINKMGDHPWFVAEVAGARQAALENGANFLNQDVQFNADLAITTLDTMIANGVNGIAIAVPDRAIGPVVAAKAAEAGIPLVSVDDFIETADGKPVPYVGMDAYSIGLAVGAELARIYREEGWERHAVGVVSIEDPRADACMQRNIGAEEVFLREIPRFTTRDVIRVPYDNTMVNAIDVMTTVVTGNPQFTHWVYYSCNDDGVLGAARALENAGFAPDQGLGIGIDGSRACDAFGNRRPSGFRGTMWLNSANHGRVAVELLLAAIRDGAELPEKTFTEPEFITLENFEDYRAKLCG